MAYSRESTFNKDKNFSLVKIGERRPILETELNEMQEIQNYKRKELVSILYADGLLGAVNISLVGGVLNVGNMLAVLKGEILTVTPMSISVEDGDSVYIDMWEEQVSYLDEIKKGGNQQATETVPNNIMDNRINVESARRIQIKYDLSKTNTNPSHKYLKLGTISGGSFVQEVKTFGSINDLVNLVGTKATQAELEAKAYTDQQIQLVSASGIPKLASYQRIVMATEENQTVFEIPLSIYDPGTDTLVINQMQTPLAFEDSQGEMSTYTISSEKNVNERYTFTLKEGVKSGTGLHIIIFKNVPIGPDGAINGMVLAKGSIPLDRLAESVASTADKITITDEGNYFLSEDLEGTLQEIGQAMNGVRGALITAVNELAQK